MQLHGIIFIPTTNIQTSLGKNYSRSYGFDSTSDTASFGLTTGLSINAQLVFGINQLVINWKNGLLTVQQAEFNLKNTIEKDYFNIVVLKKQLDLLNKVLENLKARY